MYNKVMIMQLLSLLTAVFVLAAAHGNVSADVNNFRFKSFDGEYHISRSTDNVGEMQVTEKLEAEFPNFDQNRGIERAIPKTYKGSDVQLNIISVKKADGSAWSYTTRSENDNLILRIGDPNVFVRGSQTYVISYTVRNVITFYDDYNELYWDVNGDAWRQPFESVRARITMDEPIANELRTERKCFTGSFGSTDELCNFNDEFDQDGASILVSANEPLRPGENLSFVLTFSNGTFSKPPLNPLVIAGWILSGILLGILLPVMTFMFMYRKWQKFGKDPKGKGIIVPEYKPPKGINPLIADVVLTQKRRTLAVSATIMELCVRKHVTIYEKVESKLFGKKTTYELELVSVPSPLNGEQKTLLTKLFPDLKPGSKADLTALKQKLYSSVPQMHKQAEESAVSAGYFTQTPTKARGASAVFGVLLIASGIGLLFVPIIRVGAIGLVIAGLIKIIFGTIMPARTETGLATKVHLEGLKMYMQLAEADRIQTLQSPKGSEKTPVDTNNKQSVLKVYEQLLPYAILFGIEKDWAKELSALYTEPPTWYHSNQAFNAVLFSQALQNVNSASLNSFSAPSSSGSSGMSGGGGFSGGGGGGGGGGGW